MTILGLAASRELAVIWADSETFRDGEPSGNTNKLAISPTALAVGAHTGWIQVGRAGREAVVATVHYDDVLDLLPGLLRRAAAQAADRRSDPWRYGENVFVVAGYSTRLRRVMAFELHAADGFEPTPTRAFASPDAPDLAALHPGCATDIIGVAQMQFAELRRALPGASAGVLATATLTAEGIATCRLNLDTGTLIGAARAHPAPAVTHVSTPPVTNPHRREHIEELTP